MEVLDMYHDEKQTVMNSGPLGNPLAVTDPRGFTTVNERNEMGEVYRTISPAPYNYCHSCRVLFMELRGIRRMTND